MAHGFAELAIGPTARTMKVAIVCPYDIGIPGGVQAQVVGLARELAGRGNDAWIVAPGMAEDANIRSVGRSRPIRSNDSVAPLGIHPRTWRRVKAATAGADVVHIHEPFMPLVSWAAQTAEPRLLTFHADPPTWVHRLYRTAGGALSKVVEGSAGVTAVSPIAAAALRPLGVDVAIVPNGISIPGQTEPIIEALSVAFVGRDEPRKGLDVLLHAWPRVRASIPDAHLTVIGNATAVPIAGVDYAGVCSDAEKFDVLDRTSLFVAPNRRGESFGITVAEAMAHGCAVVASDLPAFRHVGGDVPEFVEPGNAVDLADVLIRLLRDQNRLADMAARGAERAHLFSWDTIVNTYLEMYHNAAFI